MLQNRLFPQLQDSQWGYINLNSFACMTMFMLKKLGAAPGEANPFLDPNFIAELVGKVHETFNFGYSYGGYLEERKDIWSGAYMKPGQTLHLGIDYNVPAGTGVYCPMSAEVIHSFADPDMDGGWGGRLVLRATDEYARGINYIIGHLDPSILAHVGYRYIRGDKIGNVGDQTNNGGWFPHLHVQCLSQQMLEANVDKLAEIDGYGSSDNWLTKHIYPDPETTIMQFG